jgi:hypothetical protein
LILIGKIRKQGKTMIEPDKSVEGATQERFPSAGVDQRSHWDAGGIRADDIEPYVTLQYIARMLKLLAVLVVVGIVVEAAVGLSTEGMSALISVIAQGVWSLMIAGGLWGTADLTSLAIDVGHDIRADRILLGRLAAPAAAKADRE